MNINNSYDRHLDPPDDDIEQEYCEYCNQELEYHEDRLDKKTVDIWWKCTNPFCPEKWTSEIVHNMADHLVEVEQELHDLYIKYNAKSAKLLLLTQSQSNAVVRDTAYQIGRMEGSLECMKECSDWDNFYEEFALVEKEWNEVKKILENR